MEVIAERIFFFRLPKYILQKRCLCQHCIMPSKSNPSLVEQNHLYNSMEITLKVPVLHLTHVQTHTEKFWKIRW